MAKAKAEQTITSADTILIEIPWALKDEVNRTGYMQTHIDLHLRQEDHLQFRKLLYHLTESQARLSSGLFVKSPADVVRWMVEQLPK